MSEATSNGSKPRTGRTAGGKRHLRSQLALAALELFVSRGYEGTTVEDIVEMVGVGRRTFFRYFRTKEEVVFPGHEEALARVVADLDAADDSEPALWVIGRTAETVLNMYLAEPELSLKRFELTRQVESLRDREIASIDRYQRVFARYLRRRYGEQPHGEVRAAVSAASVVATHNHVLRRWLRSGGTTDAHAELRSAMEFVGRAMSTDAGAQGASSPSHDVVVSVVRTSAPADVVRGRVERTLRELGEADH